MTPIKNTPSTIADYAVLPLQIPPTASYPTESFHYIYLRPHDPKMPDVDSPRSLFVVNVPIDSAEQHFRSLFAAQKFGGVRVDRVDFDNSRPAKKAIVPAPSSTKKRKRETLDPVGGGEVLPKIWDRTIHRSGSSAVVVFVDRPSMEVAWKGIRKAAKARESISWGQEIDSKVPALGSKRE